MADAAPCQRLTLGELTVVVHEMTVREVREITRDSADRGVDVVGDWLLEDCSLHDLVRMTDATLDQLDALRPSQVQQLLDECKKVNPLFFAMTARLQKQLQQARANG